MSPAQAMLEKVLAEALTQHGIEIKPNGTDTVRAVRKDQVRFAFKAAYTDAATERQAWRRSLSQTKTTVAEGTVGGVTYLWRTAPSS